MYVIKFKWHIIIHTYVVIIINIVLYNYIGQLKDLAKVQLSLWELLDTDMSDKVIN